jgi:5-(aminomethyl)-3-furanmethanol phosphate kinase
VAYLASRLRARKLILVTDVDGVFDNDPKEEDAAKLIKRLSAKRLLELNMRTSVDLYLPKLLLKAQMNCYVVNGRYPDRIKAILAEHLATCTFIFARAR